MSRPGGQVHLSCGHLGTRQASGVRARGCRGLEHRLLADDSTCSRPRDGSAAGYVRKQDLMDPECETKTVVDETLTRVVGHMVPDVGFVPL